MMNILLVYMIKVSVYLSSLYLIYSLLLSKDTSYSRNRFFILSSLCFSFLLPIINLHTAKPHDFQFVGKLLSVVLVRATDSKETNAFDFSFSGLLNGIFKVYIIMVMVFIFKFIIDLINLRFLIYKHRSEGSHIIRFHGFSTSGFSAMGYIFINTRLSPEDAGEIIRHEQNHIKKNHFIDIIFIELMKAFQWYNPFVYLFDRSLRAVHEYQADEECLSGGIPVSNYQSLLLCQVFKSKVFKLSNSFSNPSMIKKRMIMMTKKRTPGAANMKLLIVIPVLAIVSFTISAYNGFPKTIEETVKNSAYGSPPPPPPVPADDETDSGTEPFIIVEQMPTYPGGEHALIDYMRDNTIYPEAAKINNIQGKVIIKFCVSEKGTVKHISVLKGVSPELDQEAMRVVSTFPKFQPGLQGGKPVPVWYMVPIEFTLL